MRCRALYRHKRVLPKYLYVEPERHHTSAHPTQYIALMHTWQHAIIVANRTHYHRIAVSPPPFHLPNTPSVLIRTYAVPFDMVDFRIKYKSH